MTLNLVFVGFHRARAGHENFGRARTIDMRMLLKYFHITCMHLHVKRYGTFSYDYREYLDYFCAYQSLRHFVLCRLCTSRKSMDNEFRQSGPTGPVRQIKAALAEERRTPLARTQLTA